MLLTHVLKIQHADQVGHMLPAPVDHAGQGNVAVPSAGKPLLHKENVGGMVCVLSEDTAAAGERGDNIERQSPAWYNAAFSMNTSIFLTYVAGATVTYLDQQRYRPGHLDSPSSILPGSPWEHDKA